MPFFAAVDAPWGPESMKFPVNSLLAGNSAFRDGFARDSLLQRRVCEPSVPQRRDRLHMDEIRVLTGLLRRVHANAVNVNASDPRLRHPRLGKEYSQLDARPIVLEVAARPRIHATM